MRQISGNLSLMSVMDILQWGESCKRSGTLLLTLQNQEKRFYIQNGKIIFIWSECEGERLIDFLQFESNLNQKDFSEILHASKSLDLSLFGYVLSKGIVKVDRLEDILFRISQIALTDALQWGAGTFVFTDELPALVLNGPVKLSLSQVMMESVRIFDEGQFSNNVDTKAIVDEIRSRISQNAIELPPIPDVMLKVMEKVENPSSSMDEIIECITDQLLISKILKICNSPYYRQIGTVETLKEAVLFIGLKSLISIIAVHALSQFSPKNSTEIKKVLQHSLQCGIIARQLAKDMQSNSDQAFICGLMHNVGKTIMLEMFDDYVLPYDAQVQLIEEHHAEVGHLLAKKWNFSEDIQESILYHHQPELAVKHRGLVEIVYLSNIIAHASGKPKESANLNPDGIGTGQIELNELKDFMDRIGDLDQEVAAIMSV